MPFYVVIAAADGGQGQLGGVVERQAVAGLDDRIPHGFGESGVLERRSTASFVGSEMCIRDSGWTG